MPERRGVRFLVEVLFLAALATALGFARLSALEIVGTMALGWVVVAALEWAAWRGEPHYGSGLPPKYYVPGVQLPPAQPLEQVERGYPEAAREEAPTWIASAALRAEVLGEWPHLASAGVAENDEDEGEDENEEPEFVSASDPRADPWTVAALPEAPLEAEEPEPEPEPEPVLLPAAPASPRPAATLAVDGHVARYTLDPLGEPAARRRFGRRVAAAAPPSIPVPARPLGTRPLPGSAQR
jgi:hypothetical protein